MEKRNLRREYGKVLGDQVTPISKDNDTDTIEANVIDSKPVHPIVDKVNALAKQETPGSLAKEIDLQAFCGADFEGMAEAFTGYSVSLAGPKVVLKTPDGDLEFPFVDMVFMRSKLCHTLWDDVKKKFYKTYDGETVENSSVSVREIEEVVGKKFGFRVEFEVAIPGYEEPFQFLTSGTAHYRFKDYVKKTLAPNGVPPTKAITRVTSDYVKNDKGNYFAPKFEFVKEVV